MNVQIFYPSFDSPIGALWLASNGESITELYMEQRRGGPSPIDGRRGEDGLFREASAQLRAYFAGALTEFDLPLAAVGSPFEQRVWTELRRIPYGVTISYGELARRVGNPNAARAVGAANGRNPISIIVPCHRVIGANGKLTGYGGGLERKQILLELEARQKNSSTLPRRSAETDGLPHRARAT